MSADADLPSALLLRGKADFPDGVILWVKPLLPVYLLALVVLVQEAGLDHRRAPVGLAGREELALDTEPHGGCQAWCANRIVGKL